MTPTLTLDSAERRAGSECRSGRREAEDTERGGGNVCSSASGRLSSNNSNRSKHSPADMMRDCKREVKNEFRSKSKEGLGFQLYC